jgi:hypothetical protein
MFATPSGKVLAVGHAPDRDSFIREADDALAGTESDVVISEVDPADYDRLLDSLGIN